VSTNVRSGRSEGRVGSRSLSLSDADARETSTSMFVFAYCTSSRTEPPLSGHGAAIGRTHSSRRLVFV